MQALLPHGLVLVQFDEPAATGGLADKRGTNRPPNFYIMRWRKPH